MLLHLPQKFMQAQDLSWENPSTNENAGHEPQEASQVFGSDLSKVHGHHAKRDTWKMEMRKAYQSPFMSYFAIHAFFQLGHTWMYSCDKTTKDDHFGRAADPAESHERCCYEHQYSGVYHCSFPAKANLVKSCSGTAH